jgi:hypothetical protein
MGIFDSLKNKKAAATNAAPEAASPETQARTSLQVLYAKPFDFDENKFTCALHAYDPALKEARLSSVAASKEASMWEVSWGVHQVQVVTFGMPMPAEPVAACIQPAHYDQDTKARAYAHKAHSLLFYRGQSADVAQQYVSLALVAGVLCDQDAVVVLNETARTSVPSSLFTGQYDQSFSELFGSMPPLFLFAGFVKYNLEGVAGVWMRTHGLEVWGLQNLATHVESHAQGSQIFDIFSNVADYMIDKGPILCAGHTMQVGEDIYLKLRDPNAEEAFLGSKEDVMIAEFIRADQSNPFVFNA